MLGIEDHGGPFGGGKSSGKKFASGSTGTFYSASLTDYTLSANLGFVPSVVKLKYINTAGSTYYSFRINQTNMGGSQFHNDGTGGSSDRVDILAFDGTNALKVKTGFYSGNYNIQWEAYE
jgi:hypothetical protein